jgi:hypothetical protein
MSASAISYPSHIHLPSFHLEGGDGEHEFHYEEDIYVRGRGRRQRVERVITGRLVWRGEEIVRTTREHLSIEDLVALEDELRVVLDEENPSSAEIMRERAAFELGRQLRILSGQEYACASCGCSESRACSGGCVWATKTLCSRCL